jgi:hypothetical protein
MGFEMMRDLREAVNVCYTSKAGNGCWRKTLSQTYQAMNQELTKATLIRVAQ